MSALPRPKSVPPRPIPCRFQSAAAGALAFLAGLLLATADGRAADPLRVALVAGCDQPAYDADRTLEKLKRNLEALHPFACTLILPNREDGGFDRIGALRDADVALFLVRRRSPPPEALAEIRKFVESGRGLIAVGPTGQAWENWKTFDVDVLGAKFGGLYAEERGTTELRLRAHPIFHGGEDYSTDKYAYKHTDLAKDVQVLMEASDGAKFTPVAWTRELRGTRIFYLSPARKQDFDQVSHFRIIANSIYWAARREIPGAGTRLQRTWMPNAYPSSLAVGFASGLNFCFDPTRGTVAYAWDGDYIDRWPNVGGKFPRDAIVHGQVFFKAPEQQAFRAESPGSTEIRFRGYRMESNVPTFNYEVDGLVVSETVSAKPDRSGLNRHFRVKTPTRPFRFKPENPRLVSLQAGGAVWAEDQLQLPPNSVIEFDVFVPRKDAP